MKVSYALALLAGGFLSSGYHTMPDKLGALFFFLGVVALVASAVVNTVLEQ